jgi:hypothetical protein
LLPKALEDTGVAAYNGAGKLITNPLFVTGRKIVSVEARHASAIRSLINLTQKILWRRCGKCFNRFDVAKIHLK